MASLEQLAISIKSKMAKAENYNKKAGELQEEAETAAKKRDAMKISAGKDLMEAKNKTDKAGIAFARWCEENKITRSKAYAAMAAAGDDDPEGKLKAQREAHAAHSLKSYHKTNAIVPQVDDLRDNEPAASAVPISASPTPAKNKTGDVIEFRTPNIANKRQPTEFEKAEVAQASFFRQLGEDEFAELLISGLELIAGRASFDKVVDWGIEWRQIQKDKTRGKV
jgi:hypothetical protein